jgi:hypothetical protein
MEAVNITEKFAEFSDYWSPKIVGELNGQHIRLVKLQGEFVWHHHDFEKFSRSTLNRMIARNILPLYGEYAEFFSLSTRIRVNRRKLSA